jgi:hypothetical protein
MVDVKFTALPTTQHIPDLGPDTFVWRRGVVAILSHTNSASPGRHADDEYLPDNNNHFSTNNHQNSLVIELLNLRRLITNQS